ncbi:imidazole glycerol phosphate synthase subunit HisH [Staphylococcus condimenti]|uniref:Imidazole glycerol phosphate synthase subunit HisH n=1 Tax=Staphylococcus condimenti TaxID=70255 RepID=A0A143PB26_9STAP|nr:MULTISPECIES: imidazole glycerol phosphate synthase subunit HisH [Staphylococcus]AMY05288.1 imidazole glycerol phosphate synthase subunit HisH [Staphylococcus condimenti]APR61494.1 imidazole glycerol phosphate synthase subunit HisH [Staphylococcus condimenti]OFO98750.1 imidazole glycerol phosphate synthase subunit HisH [Staphylococcus sp. HMSC065E08]PNZ58357.1 imidazole glycerol phosphate synthase subunit HisH [Staphylococcus condimenti]QQS82904.1 imidazole glycerol phosphate synthase subun
MIAIVDYGVGNIKNVERAIHHLGYETALTNDPEVIRSSSHIVLPGVGHFKDAMQALKGSGLDKILIELQNDKPFIGICLGMQLMFNHSAEGDTNGLGMINGEVVPIKTDYPVPHLGWNNLESKHPLLNQDVYFIHSYYVQTDAPIVATADYGLPITAIVQSGNKIGIQFHPEKSGDYGLEILNQALKGGFIHD